MKDLRKLENVIRNHYRQKNRTTRASAEFHAEVLESALRTRQDRPSQLSTFADLSVGRFIMKHRKTQLAAVVVFVTAVIVAMCVFHQGATPAYAVDQTFKAIREIKTVYMAGEFYKQGEFECWMRFDGDPDRPTHVWLGRSGDNLCKICSPDGVFGLNKRTNRIHFASRDERGKSWIPRFGSLFRDMVRQAGRNDTIRISDKEDMISVHIDTSQREQEFLVDAQTKLPVRFTTLRDDNPIEMMRKTLAVKHLREIRYNEQPPAGIFDRPADAVVVQQEVDCLVDPDFGLVADGMTRQEASLAIVRQTGHALVEVDQATLCKLDLFFRLYPPQVWEQIKEMKEAGQWVSEVAITGAPYQEGDLWYVPVEIRNETGPSETQNAMIKFYQLEGKTLCFIIGSKEKGVVD